MKKFLTLLLVIALLVPSHLAAGGGKDPQYWICSQVGTLDEEHVYAISNVFAGSSSHYEEKEMAFEDATLTQTDDKFQGEFQGHCYNFRSKGKASKFLKRKLQQAHKRNFEILWIKFSY